MLIARPYNSDLSIKNQIRIDFFNFFSHFFFLFLLVCKEDHFC